MKIDNPFRESYLKAMREHDVKPCKRTKENLNIERQKYKQFSQDYLKRMSKKFKEEQRREKNLKAVMSLKDQYKEAYDLYKRICELMQENKDFRKQLREAMRKRK